MTEKTIIGEVTNIINGNDVLLIRSSGEQILATEGTPVFEGDTIYARTNLSAIVRMNQSNNPASELISVTNESAAMFNGQLVSKAIEQLKSASNNPPIEVGTEPTVELIALINKVDPSTIITSPEKEADGETVTATPMVKVTNANTEKLPGSEPSLPTENSLVEVLSEDDEDEDEEKRLLETLQSIIDDTEEQPEEKPSVEVAPDPTPDPDPVPDPDPDPTIYGTAGNDNINGTAGDDIINALAGNDVVTGGQGSDTLTGGSGADTFTWQTGDADGSTDTITDFTVGDGDALDLSDILIGETPETVAGYLTLTGSTLTVDSNGAAAGGDTLTINLTGYTGVGSSTEQIEALVNNGNIIVDGRTAVNGTSDDDNFSGSSDNEAFYSKGLSGSFPMEFVTGNGGSDAYILEEGDIPNTNSAADNVAYYTKLNDFVIGDLSSNAEADKIDLSDLLKSTAANGDGNITAMEAANYIHLAGHPYGGNETYLHIDLDGGFDDAERAAMNSFGSVSNSYGVDGVVRIVHSGPLVGGKSTLELTTGVDYGVTQAEVANQIQSLIDLGFLEIN